MFVLIIGMTLLRTSAEDREIVLKDFEKCVASNGISGTVGFVWPLEENRIGYFPQNIPEFRGFCQERGYDFFKDKINGEINFPA